MVAGRRAVRVTGLAGLVFGLVAWLVFGLVAGLAAPTGAQSAPRPRPAPPAKPGAHLPLDRRVFPFFPLQGAWTTNTGIAPAAPAATDGVRLFVPFAGEVAIFSLTTGAQISSRPLPTTLVPVVDDGRVLVTGDRVIDAFRAADASPLWKTPLAAPAAFAPVARGGWVFVPLASGAVTGLRADTGATVWTMPVGAPTAAPVVEGDRLYAAASGGALHALAVADGTTAWQVTLDSDATALTAVAGHVFVATSGRWLYALDADKGRVRWRFRLQGAAIGLTVDEDRIVAVMLDQSIRAFKIGSGAQAWRQELSFRPAGGPVIAGQSVLVTGFGPNLRAVDRKTGANQGSYALPVAIDASGISLETLAAGPLVWNGATLFDDVVFLMTQHGLLHGARRAFEPPATPITVLPGIVLAVPAPPDGMPVTPDPPAATPTSTATPSATTAPVPPPTAPPPTTPRPTAPPSTPPAAPPTGGRPPRTPPAPPAR
ncbi:MAG: PQQ-binding-like beta-propeller repeat protein [Vicinamibacteraceae bacterium]